jgi:hypothetical protein
VVAETGLLLPTDTVTLYAPGELDEHGWRLDGAQPAWTGPGNLQLAAGVSNPQAASGGGHGPFGPARDETGTLFLPREVVVADGYAAAIRGRLFVVSQVRFVTDPAEPGAGIACQAMTVTSVDGWPEGGQPRGG